LNDQMIEYKQGNLLDVTQGVIIHGCNSKGVFGSGVALAVRNKYPQAYRSYQYQYNKQRLKLGYIDWCRIAHRLWIANAVTQQNYGREKKQYVDYNAITTVFTEAIEVANTNGFNLNFPKIGAGLGGGDWNTVEQLINDCDPEDKVKKICWEL